MPNTFSPLELPAKILPYEADHKFYIFVHARDARAALDAMETRRTIHKGVLCVQAFSTEVRGRKLVVIAREPANLEADLSSLRRLQKSGLDFQAVLNHTDGELLHPHITRNILETLGLNPLETAPAIRLVS